MIKIESDLADNPKIVLYQSFLNQVGDVVTFKLDSSMFYFNVVLKNIIYTA